MGQPPAPQASAWRTPLVVIVAGCAIALIGFGIRSVFGFFLEPMTLERGWDRETYSIALSVQNLLWGLCVPIAGALADRFGPTRVIVAGALVYALGTWGMSVAESGSALVLTAGLLVGVGVAFTAFSIALASMARVVAREQRSFVLGLGTAAGSFGQVVFSLFGQGAISLLGWQDALLALAASAFAIIPLAFVLPRASSAVGEAAFEQTLAAALREAAAHRGFVLLTLGFFVCGFQIAFVTVHFPAYIADLGLSPWVAAWAWLLVGGCNIAGCLAAGMAGQRWRKRSGLAAIYFARTIVIVALLAAPKTALTFYLFAIGLGFTWLATVPPTAGVVGKLFGTRYLATLFGLTLLSHQTGAFFGAWLGGIAFAELGNYNWMWYADIVLAALAALLNLPIREPRIVAVLKPA